MNHSTDYLESLEQALRQVDPGPPPSNLAARCIVALPVKQEEKAPSPFTLFWKQRRFAFVGAAFALLILIAVWTTWPSSRKDGTTLAPASAFAEAMSAMEHVTAWRATFRQIPIDINDSKHKSHYDFKYGWVESTDWFDVRRGFYSEQPNRDRKAFKNTLMLPNGDWYYRVADGEGWDKVRITRIGESYWQKMCDIQLKNIRTPAYWVNNFDQPATAPPTIRSGKWKGRPAHVFTFDVTDSVHYKYSDSPTKRTEIYTDPITHLVIARQQFIRWPDHPERGEKATYIQEIDYTPEVTASHFDPKPFCAGTKEIQRQAGGTNVSLDPE